MYAENQSGFGHFMFSCWWSNPASKWPCYYSLDSKERLRKNAKAYAKLSSQHFDFVISAELKAHKSKTWRKSQMA